MTKQDIIDYVVTTPHNSNKAVLSTMLDDIGEKLPAVTTEDNGKVLTVVNGTWNKAEASGGGAGFFVVKTTNYDQDEGTWSRIDHTFAEIRDALNNGSIPILMVADGNAIDEVYHFDNANSIGTRIEFIRTSVDSNNVATTSIIVINSDGTITKLAYTCPRQ